VRYGSRVGGVFRFVEHVGEVEVEIEASTPAAVLEEAVGAVAALLSTENSSGGPRATHEVTVAGRDLPALLPGLVDELVFLADTEGFLPLAGEATIEGLTARVTVSGVVGRPAPLVKAATLHRLLLEPGNGGWRGRVVLDV